MQVSDMILDLLFYTNKFKTTIQKDSKYIYRTQLHMYLLPWNRIGEIDYQF